MTHPNDRTFADVIESIKNLYRGYSIEDIATTLFVSHLWLPNIASPVKHILFSMILCSLKPDEYAKTSAINNYSEFQEFLNKLYILAPDFIMLEDYVPELDWGEVKFQLNEKRYHIFYGCDLSNVFDYLTLFQILYEPVDQKYMELAHRSPMNELKSILSIQDQIITSISSQPDRNGLTVSPGETGIPSESFWNEAVHVYKLLNFEEIAGKDFLENFSIKSGELPPVILSEEKFGDAVADDRTFPNIFVELDGRHFLILPRRMSGVLFDTWGELLERYRASIIKQGRLLEVSVAGGFCRFVKERFSEEVSLLFVSARSGENTAHEIIFPVVIKSRDKLVLFYILPPSEDGEVITSLLADISPKLKEAIQFLKQPPTQLIMHLKNQLVEFRSDKEDDALTPELFILIPQTYTGPFLIKLKEEPPGRVQYMDSMLAILDELYKVDELSDFLEYLEEIEKSFMSPLTSLLDKFASYKDMHGVLIGGALTPNMVMIDPHWGSRFRYESLAKFWSLYPERGLFGNPRSWQIIKEGPRRIRLAARSYFGSTLHFKIGKVHAFFTAPFDKMSFEQGYISNFLMECAEDNLYQYKDVIGVHRVFEKNQEILVLFFPFSLVNMNTEFKHLWHLSAETTAWCADVSILDTLTIGVRIVFNEEIIRQSFLEIQDRSMEAALLLEIMRKIDSRCHDPKIKGIIDIIEKGKTGKPRFMFFTEKMPASFPELIKPCQPLPHHFKLAKKRLAELAMLAGLPEGKYDLATAKDKLNVLRKEVFTEINKIVKEFNFESSIPKIIGWADAILDRRERERMTIEHSLEHDVDYNREELYSKNEEDYLRIHRSYRYLIEKFVQLQPAGKQVISEEQACRLLAFIDWFFVIIQASDIIHYDINPVGLTIDQDFLIEVEYSEDINEKETQFAQEQAQLRLGIIGNTKDAIKYPKFIKEQMPELDEAFHKDYGFRFTNLISVMIMLTHWPEHAEAVVVAPSYSATKDEIAVVAQKAIDSIGIEEIDPILDFLTLKSDEVLRVLNDEHPCDDLPVWEHKKRFARYTIRPLIKKDQKYIWGPYATRGAGIIWSGSPSSGTLPIDIDKKNIDLLIQKWKQLLDNEVEVKAAEIVKRFTMHVIPSAKLHRLDKAGNHPKDLGDYDVLAFYPQANTILNIECKNILPVYCIKDAKTLRETIFGIPGKDEGHFRQINKRQKYLMDHWATIARAFNWPLDLEKPPRILSLYVTPTTYWWTRYPPHKVNTTFVQIEMLMNFIEGLSDN